MKIGNFLKTLFARIYGVRGEPETVAPVSGSPATPVSATFPEINRVSGKTIRAGAFEFLAATPLGEIRGRLADPEREPPEGAPVFIRIPSKCIRIDTTPPEENAFAGKVVSCVPVGKNFEVRFETAGGFALHILAAEAPPECEPDESLYAWAFPEDIVGG